MYSQIFESRKLDELYWINLYWTFSLAVLPQVWSSDNHALHLREPFPGNFASLIRQCEFISKYFRDFQSEVCSPDWRLATILGDRICRLSLDLSRRNTATWVIDDVMSLRDVNMSVRSAPSAFLRFTFTLVHCARGAEWWEWWELVSHWWWCWDVQVSKVGVFSCGPRAVTRANSRACEQVSLASASALT